jgi:alkanesulfonate monooxygenase SsuD/methylene tetrahydromethanopterin reductase-like flavin-dependent oxidoreductase (luciferase family)
VADHVFGLTKAVPLMVKQLEELDAALVVEKRNPEDVGILWSIRLIVGETEDEAKALREALIAGVPTEAAGVWLSHNTGYDMSQLPPRFSLAELQQRIVAANASPVGFVGLMAKKYGEHAEITREEFFAHGMRAATGYSITIAGTAAQVADQLEEMFEATGSRGGFMISISQAAPREIMLNIIDYLVPELQRRGRYRTAYAGRTLRENLAA